MRNCIVCGQDITHKRRDSITCSDVCRKRLQRFHDRIGDTGLNVLDGLMFIGLAAHDSFYKELALRELEGIVEYAKAIHADIMMGQSPRELPSEKASAD